MRYGVRDKYGVRDNPIPGNVLANAFAPFTGEIGYELSAWIPYITGYMERYPRDDYVAISRGGTDSWYPCQVLNAYDVIDPEEFNTLYQMRQGFTGSYKARNWFDPLDSQIWAAFGFNDGMLAQHASVMWPKLDDIHEQLVRECFRPGNPIEPWPGLPDKYVAVRLYENDFLDQALTLTGDLPIVELKPRGQIDNHREFPPMENSIVVEYDAYDSLAVISRVVAHAREFITTYGGLAWIGPKFGVPTKGLASRHCPNSNLAHLEPFTRINLK